MPSIVPDLLTDLVEELAASRLFALVNADPAGEPDLALETAVLRERSVGGSTAPRVEIAVHFQLKDARFGGVVWSKTYEAASPADILFRTPLDERGALVARRYVRRVIIKELQADLNRVLFAF